MEIKMGFMPITKRTNHGRTHSNEIDLATEIQVKLLIDCRGYTPERAKALKKTQASNIIDAQFARNRQNRK